MDSLPKEYFKLLREFEFSLWIHCEDPWDVDDFALMNGSYDKPRLLAWLRSCPAYLDWAYEDQTNIPRFDFYQLAKDLQRILTHHRIYRDYKRKEQWIHDTYSNLEKRDLNASTVSPPVVDDRGIENRSDAGRIQAARQTPGQDEV